MYFRGATSQTQPPQNKSESCCGTFLGCKNVWGVRCVHGSNRGAGAPTVLPTAGLSARTLGPDSNVCLRSLHSSSSSRSSSCSYSAAGCKQYTAGSRTRLLYISISQPPHRAAYPVCLRTQGDTRAQHGKYVIYCRPWSVRCVEAFDIGF